MASNWQVKIPTGRWMAGVNWFQTKAKALDFTKRWNETEAASGGKTLNFERAEGTNIYEVPR